MYRESADAIRISLHAKVFLHHHHTCATVLPSQSARAVAGSCRCTVFSVWLARSRRGEGMSDDADDAVKEQADFSEAPSRYTQKNRNSLRGLLLAPARQDGAHLLAPEEERQAPVNPDRS